MRPGRDATLRDHEWVINGSKQFITNSGTDITSLCTDYSPYWHP